MEIPEPLVARIRQFVEDVKQSMIRTDIIWDEHPGITYIHQYNPQFQRDFNRIEVEHAALHAELRGLAPINQLIENTHYMLFEVFWILHQRRQHEWYLRRRADYQMNRNFNYVQQFTQNQMHALVHDLSQYQRATLQPLLIGRRDRIALLRPDIQDLFMNRPLSHVLEYTPDLREWAGMPRERRVLTLQERTREIQAAIDSGAVDARLSNQVAPVDLAARFNRALVLDAAPAAPAVVHRYPPPPPPIVANGRSNSEEFTCGICLQDIQPGHETPPHYKTPCGHRYCLGCLQEWLHRKNSCPSCRQSIH